MNKKILVDLMTALHALKDPRESMELARVIAAVFGTYAAVHASNGATAIAASLVSGVAHGHGVSEDHKEALLEIAEKLVKL